MELNDYVMPINNVYVVAAIIMDLFREEYILSNPVGH